MSLTYYLETGSTDPAYNLAFEEYVLRNRRSGDYLILWQNRNAVIVGRNQNALEEINREFVEQHGIRVIRRNTGGGAVYHDMGNLNYSFITDALEQEATTNSRFTIPIVRALKKLGLDAESSGRNDILVSGQKVSGTAQYRMAGRILHHGTLLFDSDPNMIVGSLNPDPTKFQSKSIKSVRSRVGNIRSALHDDMDLPSFWNYLKTELSEGDFLPSTLSQQELEQITVLKQEKYDTWQWNFGTSPKFDTQIRRRWPGGLLELHLTVTHGVIESLQIFGDFLALTPVEMLTTTLIGCSYHETAITAALSSVSLTDCLGGITEKEFITTILNR